MYINNRRLFLKNFWFPFSRNWTLEGPPKKNFWHCGRFFCSKLYVIQKPKRNYYYKRCIQIIIEVNILIFDRMAASQTKGDFCQKIKKNLMSRSFPDTYIHMYIYLRMSWKNFNLIGSAFFSPDIIKNTSFVTRIRRLPLIRTIAYKTSQESSQLRKSLSNFWVRTSTEAAMLRNFSEGERLCFLIA